MSANANKESTSFFEKFKHKFQLIIYNEFTFEEVWRLRVSAFNIFTYIIIFAIILTSFTIVLIAYTPLKEFIPGFPGSQMLKNIHNNAVILDSLSLELERRDKHLKNIKSIIDGTEITHEENKEIDTTQRYNDIEFTKSKEDSILRENVETEGQYNLSLLNSEYQQIGLNNLHFFPPVEGLVINEYNASTGHFAVDVVADSNAVISAVLDGTVVMSSWTLETGYVLHIQHRYNLVSIYKHNSVLLKKQGDRVKAGETIAIIGNTGEITTGAHLHFELWHKGKALNPENFIIF